MNAVELTEDSVCVDAQLIAKDLGLALGGVLERMQPGNSPPCVSKVPRRTRGDGG